MSSVLSSVFELIKPAMMMVLLYSQKLDVSLHLVNLLKWFINLGCDEEAGKYGCDGRVAFYLVFGEIHHYLMALDCVPHNCGSLINSGRTQRVPPQNTIPIQVIKTLPQMVG